MTDADDRAKFDRDAIRSTLAVLVLGFGEAETSGKDDTIGTLEAMVGQLIATLPEADQPEALRIAGPMITMHHASARITHQGEDRRH